MPTNFPAGLDSLADPITGDTVEAAHVDNLGDAVEAIEAKLGVDGSAVTGTIDNLLKAADEPGHTHSGISGASYSTTVEDETAYGQSSAAGVSATTSRGDHTHGSPAHGVSQHAHSTLHTTSPLIIIETSTGVWTADAPSRTSGQYPIIFIADTDPADATNGITTPANINPNDVWYDRSP